MKRAAAYIAAGLVLLTASRVLWPWVINGWKQLAGLFLMLLGAAFVTLAVREVAYHRKGGQ